MAYGTPELLGEGALARSVLVEAVEPGRAVAEVAETFSRRGTVQGHDGSIDNGKGDLAVCVGGDVVFDELPEVGQTARNGEGPDADAARPRARRKRSAADEAGPSGRRSETWIGDVVAALYEAGAAPAPLSDPRSAWGSPGLESHTFPA